MSVVYALMLISVPQILLFIAVFIITGRQEISMKTTHANKKRKKERLVMKLLMCTIDHSTLHRRWTLCIDCGLGKWPQKPIRKKKIRYLNFDVCLVVTLQCFSDLLHDIYSSAMRWSDRSDDKDAHL